METCRARTTMLFWIASTSWRSTSTSTRRPEPPWVRGVGRVAVLQPREGRRAEDAVALQALPLLEGDHGRRRGRPELAVNAAGSR